MHAAPADENAFRLLTGAGPAAISVIRLRGPRVESLLAGRVQLSGSRAGEPLRPGARRARLLDADGRLLDDILVSVHAVAPFDIRLHLHGSPWVVVRLREILQSEGFSESEALSADLWAEDQRPADADARRHGETGGDRGLRAAEAIAGEVYAHLPLMKSRRGADWLLRQSTLLPAAFEKISKMPHHARAAASERLMERRVWLDWFANPVRIALVGPPNAGKSTLANALADQAVCIVSELPGTTRDYVEVAAEADGFPVTWIDTAGVGDTRCEIEAEGVARTRQMLNAARAVVLVLDQSQDWAAAAAAMERELAGVIPAVVMLNKSDLARGASRGAGVPERWRDRVVVASASTRAGLDVVLATLWRSIGRARTDEFEAAIFTDRQANAARSLLVDLNITL